MSYHHKSLGACCTSHALGGAYVPVASPRPPGTTTTSPRQPAVATAPTATTAPVVTKPPIAQPGAASRSGVVVKLALLAGVGVGGFFLYRKFRKR